MTRFSRTGANSSTPRRYARIHSVRLSGQGVQRNGATAQRRNGVDNIGSNSSSSVKGRSGSPPNAKRRAHCSTLARCMIAGVKFAELISIYVKLSGPSPSSIS